ncbi:Transcriptional regulator, ArsR family [hydrothermal vent metagenome]|uniref:Transcriptional regulator, ArsR family n=1 Tax=hydrothermal vent metagenome TaxID=652676 RepID=A0A1W1BSU7_9ZZZZ
MADEKKLHLLASDDEIENATMALKAMAHNIRLKILCVLKENELTVSEILEAVGSSQSNISQHLDILKNKQILDSHRVGNKILYSIKNIKVLKLIENMRMIFCEID